MSVQELYGGSAGDSSHDAVIFLEHAGTGDTALAACDLALRETVAYVKQREVFGKRLMDMQNTRFILAKVKTKTEVLRSFLYDCIGRLLDGNLHGATAAFRF